MIVLRKIGKVSKNNILLSEPLIGDKNGLNKIFTTPHSFNAENISISINGQKLISPNDFEITGDNEITLVYIAPTDNDNIGAMYEVA